MITQDQVKKLFDYQDGNLIRKIGYSRAKIGEVVGYLSSGRLKTTINNKGYYISRVIFLWHKGYLPKEVDHIDLNPLNNKIENLRGCTGSQNCMNTRLRPDNALGIKGVSFNKNHKKYYAQVSSNKKQILIGAYNTPEEARDACIAARNKYHGEFANHG